MTSSAPMPDGFPPNPLPAVPEPASDALLDGAFDAERLASIERLALAAIADHRSAVEGLSK